MPKPKLKLTAAKADKHSLYEASVQDTESDIRFIQRIFLKSRGRTPLTLREDFCGTARLCADWAQSLPKRRAVGVDLHQPTLDWGTREHLAELTPEVQNRVRLVCKDVRDNVGLRTDVTVAFNFSYCVFKERATFLDYLKKTRMMLNADGALFMDIHGGTESFVEMTEQVRHKGFTYVWDQGPYDAVGGLAMRHIHFRFPDGTQLKRAFSYDWRIWNLPELQDLLHEAGYKKIEVYWEGADERGHGNGIFRKVTRADNERSWIAYVVAWR